MKSGNGAGQITTISAYNAATRVATLSLGFNIAVNAGDTYDIYTNTEKRRITKFYGPSPNHQELLDMLFAGG